MKAREAHLRKKLWFLKGAAWAVDQSYNLPITDEGMKHFMLGADCVASGSIVINDITAFQAHIDDIQSGQVAA